MLIKSKYFCLVVAMTCYITFLLLIFKFLPSLTLLVLPEFLIKYFLLVFQNSCDFDKDSKIY